MSLSDAGDKYYYCPDCGKFHRCDDDTVVSRKLCFVCDKEKKQKTKIVGNDKSGKLQVCSKCYKAHNFSGFDDDFDEDEGIAFVEVFDKMFGNMDETKEILDKFGIDAKIFEMDGFDKNK